MLGPLLIPENYAHLVPSPNSPSVTNPSLPPNNTNAPFEWLHFEGRSVKTTLNNMVGIDGLARERKWRNRCVFSLDVGRKARQGVQAVGRFADLKVNHINAPPPVDAPWGRDLCKCPLCKGAFTCSRCNPEIIPPIACNLLFCGTSRTSHRLLGKQTGCCRPLPPNEGVLPEFWLGPTPHASGCI